MSRIKWLTADERDDFIDLVAKVAKDHCADSQAGHPEDISVSIGAVADVLAAAEVHRRTS